MMRLSYYVYDKTTLSFTLLRFTMKKSNIVLKNPAAEFYEVLDNIGDGMLPDSPSSHCSATDN